MNTVAFYTLGCKVNQYETEAMTELFLSRGFETVDFSEISDVYVINTCTVTSMSDRKSRQIIHRARKLNPNAVIAVTGCYAQTEPDKVLSIDGVNLVVGANNRSKIVDLVIELDNTKKINSVSDISCDHHFEALNISGYSDKTRAFVKVQEGCNQFCTYCIIPYARGPIRSRGVEDVVNEVTGLVKNGFYEVILVGIHIASYGLDLKTTNLCDLICRINDIPGLKRLRLSSIEPMTLNEEFIRKIKNCHKLCPHFHLSLQSGCDETLERMNRRYTVDSYRKIVESIRENFENAAVTTDIMVGFPGETDDEFEMSAAFFDEMKFSDSHIFQYSRRPGTPADSFPNQIDPLIKERRSKVLETISEKNRSEFLQSQIGRTMNVFFEQRFHKDRRYYSGKTENYVNVLVLSDEDLTDKFMNVNITKADGKYLYGELCK